MSDQAYYMRIEIHKRVLGDEPLTTGEDPQSWVAPEPGKGRYSARPMSLNAGEEIRQGVNETQDFQKLEIRGTKLGIDATMRVKNVVTGVFYRITAEPYTTQRTTIISLERLVGVRG